MITVFLRKYSDASSTEVGTLLMVLLFASVFTKPFFCALADRHRRYKLYFILAILFTLIGFGSYSFMPFFPEFVAEQGRLAWYILVLLTVIGYIAFGVVWSLGDAYAANVAHRTGDSFGNLRLWGTIGYGFGGAFLSAVSPLLPLPEIVLGFMIFGFSLALEILVIWWWPHDEDFVMGDALPSHGPADRKPVGAQFDPGSLRAKATMTEKPPAFGELEKQQPTAQTADDIMLALSKLSTGELTIKRTQSNSLAITTKVKLDVSHQPGDRLDKTISELVARAKPDLERSLANQESPEQKLERKRIADLQMTIFRMVAMKHKSLIKYLIMFFILGTIFNVHQSYFFNHLERLAHEGKVDFSTLTGLCLVAQAVGETFCFAIAPWVVSKLGRDGSISLNAIAYVLRYYGNGMGIPMWSPYVALGTELLQGINYGIFYYLITETALHFALLVDEVIPDLERLGLITSKTDLNMVRTSLRATMQGIFSGAFDGMGFGLGALIAGMVLEEHSYEQLWCLFGATAGLVFLLHGLYELINKSIRSNLRKKDCHISAADRMFERSGFDIYGVEAYQ